MYSYQKEKPNLFTEEGQVKFLKFRDNVKVLLKQSGAVMMEKAMNAVTADTWFLLACMDRLVELDEVKELINTWSSASQHRVFVDKNSRL